LIDEKKNKGKKSRDTVPLRREVSEKNQLKRDLLKVPLVPVITSSFCRQLKIVDSETILKCSLFQRLGIPEAYSYHISEQAHRGGTAQDPPLF
jgi:hypothetical protein